MRGRACCKNACLGGSRRAAPPPTKRSIFAPLLSLTPPPTVRGATPEVIFLCERWMRRALLPVQQGAASCYGLFHTGCVVVALWSVAPEVGPGVASWQRRSDDTSSRFTHKPIRFNSSSTIPRRSIHRSLKISLIVFRFSAAQHPSQMKLLSPGPIPVERIQDASPAQSSLVRLCINPRLVPQFIPP